MPQRKTLYAAFDESNHGRYPEIFTAAFSYDSESALVLPPLPLGQLLPKRRGHQSPLEGLTEEDYSFLILDKRIVGHYKIIAGGKDRMFGDICASLVQDRVGYQNRGEFLVDDICLYLDGEKSGAEKKYVRECTTKISNLSSSKIHLVDGRYLDQRCKLVNLADAIAYYIYTKIKDKKPISSEVLLNKKPLLKIK
ncbi:MAG: hypothetical protein AABX03_01310 [Nanoarchaeota archaeon]